jgi:glycerophosphoryl diester phosphodiesterase
MQAESLRLSSWFDPERPRLLAHRGLALDAPENTLLAFLKALAAGAEYLETDVHVSRDGVAVVSHDPDLSRVAGRSGSVGDLSLAELQRIDLGHGQTFSSLSEVLDAFPEARFNIDIKIRDAVEPAASAIRAADAIGRVLVSSFDERTRAAIVQALPGVATSASSRRVAVALVGAKLGLAPLVRRALRGMHAIQIPVSYGAVTLATASTIARFQAAGVEVHFWTINDPAEMTRLLELGADGIVSDRIDLALRITGTDR